MFDYICLRVARPYTSLPNCPFRLISPLNLFNHLLSGLPRAHTTSTSFPELSLRFPPTFVALLILSFVKLCNTSIVAISATSNLCPCVFLNADVSAPCTSYGLTTVPYTFPLILAVSFSVTIKSLTRRLSIMRMEGMRMKCHKDDERYMGRSRLQWKE